MKTHVANSGMVPNVAVVGLGPMGAPIAERLVNSKVPIVVWNRTAKKTERLAHLGAEVAARPADAARAVVLTVLPDIPEVDAVLSGPDGLIAGWRRFGIADPVLVIHGTVSPVAVRKMAADLKTRWGVRVIDAPLSGGTVGARNGTLSVMAGGDLDTFVPLESIFRSYATTIKYLGPSGSGSVAKACNQVIVASTVVAVSEAVLLARRSGLDVTALFDVLAGGLANSEVIAQKSEKWIAQDYSEGGSAKNQMKDLTIALECANELGLTLHETATVAGLFSAMLENGDGELDHTGVYRAIENEAGNRSSGSEFRVTSP